MAKVVLVCPDKNERQLLEACLKGYEVASAKNYKTATQTLTESKPDLAIVRVDTKDKTGMEILRLMKRSQIHVPTIVVLPRRGTPLENEAWQIGVRTYLTIPIRYDDVRSAIEKAQTHASEKNSGGPSITDEEKGVNLTELVARLHREMKCPAGANRVLIRSVITGMNEKSEPRVCLRCPIRQAVGLEEYVYYEHLRDYCTGDYKACDAVIQYKRLRKANG